MIKLLAFTLIFSAFIAEATLPAPSFYERPYVSTAFSSVHDQDRLPLIIAHKSHVPGLPPNTIAAMQTIMQSEIGGIEIDVQLSKDKTPVIFHDDTLEGATSGKGTIGAHTVNELKKIRYILEGNITEHSIPTLEEAFQTVGKSKFLFLDIKENSILNSDMAIEVAKLIKKYNLYQTVVVETFNPFFLKKLKTIDPKIIVQFDYVEDATPTEEESPEQLDRIPWLVKQPLFHWFVRMAAMPDILGVRFSNTKEGINKLSEHGYPVIAWTIDDPDQAKELLDAGVNGVQTNNPFGLLEKLRCQQPVVVQDAGGSQMEVDRVIEITNEQDIADAIASAKIENKKISVAGAQHTMGGHTFAAGNIILKMYKYNKISYSQETTRLTVQSGATWDQIQEYLDPLGRSVIVMQSDTIFSIGGSLSANVHGWQVGSGPIASTVHQFTLMLASGEIVTCSREVNPELFSAVLGGYGLFGVILEVELETCENRVLYKQSSYIPVKDYSLQYQNLVTDRNNVQLAYGRFSVDDKHLLQDASLNVFTIAAKDSLIAEPLDKEKAALLKRKIFRLSERSEEGKRLRWTAEKVSTYLENKYHSRNNVMHPDIHVLWRESASHKDILQEYFLPKENFNAFVTTLRNRVKEYDMDLLNVTVREVLEDQDSLMAYARQDVFSFVLFFSQGLDEIEEKKMTAFTQSVIDDVLELGGTFYLPYRLHYRLDQFHQAYPMHEKFIEVKNKYDPQELFTSQFWNYINQ